MADLDEFARLGRDEQGLAVVSTVRADGSAQASLVNAGVMPHPVSGEPAVAFVTYGKVKLANLRRHPQMAATFRSGWRWATVEGRAEIIGPDWVFVRRGFSHVRQILGIVFQDSASLSATVQRRRSVLSG